MQLPPRVELQQHHFRRACPTVPTDLIPLASDLHFAPEKAGMSDGAIHT
jgi:hypothetical protein